MRSAAIVLLLLFLWHRGESRASEISKKIGLSGEVKEEAFVGEDLEKEEEEEFIGDESEDDEREGRDIVNDDQAVGDQEDEDEVEVDLEVGDGEDVQSGGDDGKVTLESVRLGWDLFKEWQEVRRHKC